MQQLRPSRRMALAKQYRLRSPRSFTQVYRSGRQANGRYLAIKALKLAPGLTKDGQVTPEITAFGISISRKVSKKAVVRNRSKRRIQAALTTLMPRVASGWWVVITVRSGQEPCEYPDFLRELEQLLKKLEVIHGH